MRTFEIDKCPYEEGVQLYKKSKIDIKSGMTILCGCNGAGKSTLLRAIQKDLEKKSIPVLAYDNIQDGRNAKQFCLERGDFSTLSALAFCSEGEQVIVNMNEYARKSMEFLKNKGKKELSPLEKFFLDVDDDKENADEPTEYWFLLDAIGSGLSIDNIVMLKDHFKTLVGNFPKNLTPYVIISANDYEFCDGEQCFDVEKCEYITFDSYDEYKTFIMKSREMKMLSGR